MGIDEVMGRAGMTRGAFYAHFKSKEDVFHAALHQETPLLASLERRVSQDQAGLLAEMRGVFETYLKPDADQATARSCTLAGLAMDVARGSDEARAAHEAVQMAVRVEMARGQAVEHDDKIVHAALNLAVGSVVLAAAQRTETGRAAVLEAGRAGVQDLLDGFAPAPASAPAPAPLPNPVPRPAAMQTVPGSAAAMAQIPTRPPVPRPADLPPPPARPVPKPVTAGTTPVPPQAKPAARREAEPPLAPKKGFLASLFGGRD